MSYKSNICFSKHDNTSLTTYESEDEAQSGANFVNTKYNNDLVPYKCSNCNEWHLSPKNRSTKSTKCYDCTDGNGNNKDLYLTENDAQQRADILYEERGVILNLYECPYNSGWHLTKR